MTTIRPRTLPTSKPPGSDKAGPESRAHQKITPTPKPAPNSSPQLNAQQPLIQTQHPTRPPHSALVTPQQPQTKRPDSASYHLEQGVRAKRPPSPPIPGERPKLPPLAIPPLAQQAAPSVNRAAHRSAPPRTLARRMTQSLTDFVERARRMQAIPREIPRVRRLTQDIRIAPSLWSALLGSLQVILRPAILVGLVMMTAFFAARRQERSLSEVELMSLARAVDEVEQIEPPIPKSLEDTNFDGQSVFDLAAEALEGPRPMLISARQETLPPVSTPERAPVKNTVVASLTPQLRADLEELKGKIKFIAGVIAVHRPTIPDCGKVARDIVELSSKEHIDPFLVAAIISIESRFSPVAKSHVGATGMMQLMPATAAHVSRQSGTKGSLTDARTNITLGIKYYKDLERQFKGNKLLALAAYNWGPANVEKVNRNPERIPRSVRAYAKTAMERHLNWANHFRKAKEGAISIERTYGSLESTKSQAAILVSSR